ncbi:hypothetical protein D3C76_1221830 [compost metagenome]
MLCISAKFQDPRGWLPITPTNFVWFRRRFAVVVSATDERSLNVIGAVADELFLRVNSITPPINLLLGTIHSLTRPTFPAVMVVSIAVSLLFRVFPNRAFAVQIPCEMKESVATMECFKLDTWIVPGLEVELDPFPIVTPYFNVFPDVFKCQTNIR